MLVFYFLLLIVGIGASWIRLNGRDEIHKLAAIMAGALATFFLFMITSAFLKLLLSIWIIWFFKPSQIIDE